MHRRDAVGIESDHSPAYRDTSAAIPGSESCQSQLAEEVGILAALLDRPIEQLHGLPGKIRLQEQQAEAGKIRGNALGIFFLAELSQFFAQPLACQTPPTAPNSSL